MKFQQIRFVKSPPIISAPIFHSDPRKKKRQMRAAKFLKRTNYVPDSVTYDHKVFAFDNLKLHEKFCEMMRSIHVDWNRTPTRLILGYDIYRELISDMNEYVKFYTELEYLCEENGRRTFKMLGLNVELCPWMQGYVMLP